MTAHARAPAAAKGGGQFLDPAVLARISNLELLAKTVVDGFLTGLHRSPYLGFSMDFAEHRQYMPGDDTRRIDWKLFGRTDRFYLKLFEAETSANFMVAVGTDGTILLYTGVKWAAQTSNDIKARNLHAVWGTSKDNVYCVGDQGVVIHYNGKKWTQMSTEGPLNTTTAIRLL